MSQPDPRRIAYYVLRKVQEADAYADLALDAELNAEPHLDPRDRALATELSYGVCRYRGRLDFALAHFCTQALAKIEPGVLDLLRLGTYQLLILDRIPPRAAVHTTVELAKKVGLLRAAGFINGVLRNLERRKAEIPWPAPEQPLDYLTHYLSLPGWLAKRWLDELGADQALQLAAAQLEAAPLTLRVNTRVTDRDSFLAQLHAADHPAIATGYAPEGVTLSGRAAISAAALTSGTFQVQDEASMLIAHLLAPQAGERILDACAAPGGKTTHIAALADNQAQITALDLHPHRVKMIKEGARRLGCSGIDARVWDLTHPPTFLPQAGFDRVLVDAPCSALGVLRRNPDGRWRRQPDDIPRLAELQRMILAQVAPLLRPGGTLVYSVCTQTAEETEETVTLFLAMYPEFSRVDLHSTVPTGWSTLIDECGALRTCPQRHGGMDGFYAVRLLRN
ncbi:MAG: 16S rRNA (cytosine(967)-C(5))-methyltransferase RsmB [Desulfuromonadaceae bacterium]|nr:16S rRNA (cytosine(967)-C(5))-methyltransferase RsmB [Desulfuromonadaceae bacterium]